MAKPHYTRQTSVTNDTHPLSVIRHPIANTWSSWNPCTTTGDGICGNTRTTNDQRLGGNTTATRGFLRGGNWSNGAQSGAFALLLSVAPTNVSSHVGFRCAR